MKSLLFNQNKMPHVEQLMQNQYPIKIPTFGLKQLVLVTRGVHAPQETTTALLINIPITTKLPVYGNGVLIQQPGKVNSY